MQLEVETLARPYRLKIESLTLGLNSSSGPIWDVQNEVKWQANVRFLYSLIFIDLISKYNAINFSTV